MRRAGVGLRMMVGALALVVFAATPAFADTSEATANALQASLGLPVPPFDPSVPCSPSTATLLCSGTVTATNDGTQASPGTVTGNTNPALSVLGTQTLLGVGALPQQARANPDGSSAACAGLVGAGGLIQIGPTGVCTPSNLPSGGVIVDLGSTGPLGVLGLRADAVLAQCTADSDGTTSASVQLVNATLGLTLLGIPGASIVLPANPGPNFVPNLGLLGLGGLLTLTLNEQSIPDGPGSIATTALHLNLLNIVDVRIGNVTCGPNAAAPPIPAIPLEGIPVAAATAAAVGLVGFGVHRRRAAARAA